jgi:hypothetical protein
MGLEISHQSRTYRFTASTLLLMPKLLPMPKLRKKQQ